jgi:hypothetical protein
MTPVLITGSVINGFLYFFLRMDSYICTIRLVVLPIALLLVGSMGDGHQSARAQSPLSQETVTRDDYVNRYARPGRATQTIYVWGAVSQPGIWEVEKGTGLVELFSVVRPTGFGTESPRTQREVVVRIRRSSNGRSRVAHEFELQELLERSPDERPALEAGDILEVRTIEERSFSFRTFSTIVGTLSSVTLLIIRFSDL